MLLSVEETAKILEVKPGHLWYLLRFGRIDGAVKICSNWRIDEYSAKEMYEQINAKRAGILPGYSKYLGFNELLENIRKTSLSSSKKSPSNRPGYIPGRFVCYAEIRNKPHPILFY